MYYLFDLDGTLIDSNGIWVDVDTAFLARRGMPYTPEYAQGVAHTIFPLAAKFTKAYCSIVVITIHQIFIYPVKNILNSVIIQPVLTIPISLYGHNSVFHIDQHQGSILRKNIL